MLKASDRQLFSADAVVHCVSLPDGDIQLVRNKPLTAVAGQVTPFNSKNVNFTSEVSPEDVSLSILTGECTKIYIYIMYVCMCIYMCMCVGIYIYIYI